MKERFALACLLMAATAARAAPVDHERRVEAHRAVERVLWAHRVWPESNPGPKPPLEQVLPEYVLRARVDDVLRKSNALAEIWKRPIGGLELQAEIDRMVRDTRDLPLLEEMFDALERDPSLIAEAIARPALTDRLIRSWYAGDSRWHGDERRDAERVLASVASAADLARVAPRYRVTSFALGEESPDAVRLDPDEWNELVRTLGKVGEIGALGESDTAYSAAVVLSRGERTVRIGVGSWPKTGFDAWWAGERFAYDPVLPETVDAGPALVLPLPNASTQSDCTNDTWTKTSSGSPSPRLVHSAVWTGSEMIVWGGTWWDGALNDYVLNTGARYNPATDSWSPMTTAGAPAARYFHEAVWTGSQMIVWGGYADYPQILTSGGRYDPTTDTWTATSLDGAPTWDPDFKAAAVWTGSKMIVWDEQTFQSPIRGSRYDPVSDSWSPMDSVNAPTFNGRVPSVVWTGSLLLMWPGKRYDPATDTWSSYDVFFQPAAREGHSAVWTGSTMIIWGGQDFNFGYHNDGAIYDPVGNSWLPGGPTTNSAPARRSEHVAGWIAGRMVVWGGYDESGQSLLQTGGRYDPATNTWDTTSTIGVPQARAYGSAVVAGNELIVWGGRLGNLGGPFYMTDTGGRYDPTSNSWVPTRIAAGPEPRSQHSAVWTGAEMILWGGAGATGFLNEGWSYVPATDSWRLVNGASAPTPRVAHTAVWTGTWMTVWGGYDGGHTNTGGRYDVASDQWYPDTTSGAPTARSDATAVWSGTRMIVWGGSNDSGVLGTGGRYDPATDTWEPVSTSGAPAPRTTHTAVWSGGSMIVWGGAASVRLDTGGRYDPATDSWTATTTTGAPAPRRNHAAVWTGSRMLIWGGSDGADLATGASYDPSADSWVPISPSGAPQARSLASAAWTGTEMIVWGGFGGVSSLDSGGRYRPGVDAWSPTTISGAPHARAFHSGIWSGARMFVWGGNRPDGGKYADGGGYCSCVAWYPDADGDGFGANTGEVTSCNGGQPPGTAAVRGDCNDGNAAVHPGVLDDACDGVDVDCDGQYDEDFLPQPSVCGAGVCRSFGSLDCVAGTVINSCVPNAPNAPTDTSCNALDDDCDGLVDEDFVSYDDHWTATATAPGARTNHTAVWSGGELLVFGGDNGSGTVQTGGYAYAPGSNSWRTLPAGPAKRWRHTATWTGSRMVVWGGDDGGTTQYNSGSRYDPATDTWVATTTTGAPTARSAHSAVWTGSRVVIWGGITPAGALNTGSRYDPVGNAWSATATSGAATARYGHTAVWTGSEMIVWGGLNQSQVAQGTGARYNPTTNTWASMTTTGAPSARYGHVAVWTGSQMIVWGGTSNGVTYLDNGARYDPATDTWSPVSGAGAPARRAFASFAWTGSELLVWGGMYRTNEEPDTPRADGARYNPATDSWSAAMGPYITPPSARARAQAVWTGTEMIVWGGDPVGAALSTGSRYNPRTLCGVGGCQAVGLTYCIDGTIDFLCLEGPALVETCDNVDNDCNGLVDDGIPVPSAHPALLASKLPGTVSYWWIATPDTTGYDVVRGGLIALRATDGDFTSSVDTCLANDLRAEAVADTVLPASGNGFWYLVRPVNLCTGNGTFDDSAPSQVGLRDAEIAASGVACP